MKNKKLSEYKIEFHLPGGKEIEEKWMKEWLKLTQKQKNLERTIKLKRILGE